MFGLSRWLSDKESAYQCRICERCRFYSLVGEIPWRRKWQPTPVFLPGNPMDKGALWAIVRRVAKNQTWLSEHNVEFTWWEWIPSASSFYWIQSRGESLFDALESLASLSACSSPYWLTLILFWTVRARSPGWEPSVGSSGWLEFSNVVFIVFILEISSL